MHPPAGGGFKETKVGQSKAVGGCLNRMAGPRFLPRFCSEFPAGGCRHSPPLSSALTAANRPSNRHTHLAAANPTPEATCSGAGHLQRWAHNALCGSGPNTSPSHPQAPTTHKPDPSPPGDLRPDTWQRTHNKGTDTAL